MRTCLAVHTDPAVLGTWTWWGWALVVPLLLLRCVGGRPEPILAASALCGLLLAADWCGRGGGFSEMSIQIRAGYVVLLLLGLAPAMAWVHVVQLIGTAARVIGGYCLLERLLRLMPWNRIEPLSSGRVWRTIATPPGRGGIVRFGADRDPAPLACELGRAREKQVGRAVSTRPGTRS